MFQVQQPTTKIARRPVYNPAIVCSEFALSRGCRSIAVYQLCEHPAVSLPHGLPVSIANASMLNRPDWAHDTNVINRISECFGGLFFANFRTSHYKHTVANLFRRRNTRIRDGNALATQDLLFLCVPGTCFCLVRAGD